MSGVFLNRSAAPKSKAERRQSWYARRTNSRVLAQRRPGPVTVIQFPNGVPGRRVESGNESA